MSEENTIQDLDAILQHQFVQDLLKLVSDLRSALGDHEGKLENSEIVERAKAAYKG
jgi:hypothetical protein